MKVRLGTRGSDLALWQAHHVEDRLAGGADCELVVIKTRGDRIQTVPLNTVDGRAFFTAEIEQALLDARVDIAVHSHKDLPTETPARLAVVAVPARGPVRELLVVAAAAHDPAAPLLPLARGARVGTSAPRRQAQLAALRPDLAVAELRGNVPTRVEKLRRGDYDAVLLAEAGVVRLGLDLDGFVVVPLDVALMIPAPGQGALAIQARADDAGVGALCAERLHDAETAAVVAAERALLGLAGGGCNLPLGVHVRRAAAVVADGAPAHAAAGDGRDGDGAWEALGFAGAGCPAGTTAPRWARATGATPDAAAHALWRRLAAGDATGAGPLSGLSVALAGSSDGGSSLGARLETLGARVHHERLVTFEDVAGGADVLAAALSDLRPGDVVAVTSRQAARHLGGVARPAGVTVAAVGPSTARLLDEYGWPADVVGGGGAAALAAVLDVTDGTRVVFPCATDALPDLPEALTARGAAVRRVELYRTVPRERAASGDEGPPLGEALDVRVYMSPSGVAAALALDLEQRAPAALRLPLGETTAAALARAGLPAAALAGGPDRTESVVATLLARRPRPASLEESA